LKRQNFTLFTPTWNRCVIGVGRRRVNNMSTNDKKTGNLCFFSKKICNNENLFETKANVTLFYAK
jgi:hypothetical protein